MLMHTSQAERSWINVHENEAQSPWKKNTTNWVDWPFRIVLHFPLARTFVKDVSRQCREKRSPPRILATVWEGKHSSYPSTQDQWWIHAHRPICPLIFLSLKLGEAVVLIFNKNDSEDSLQLSDRRIYQRLQSYQRLSLLNRLVFQLNSVWRHGGQK